MIRIYLAGPISDQNFLSALANCRRGIQMAKELMRLGYAVYCPHLDFLLALMEGTPLDEKVYKTNSLEWMSACRAILLLPGWQESRGVSDEIMEAEDLGIPYAKDLGGLFAIIENLKNEGIS